MATARKSSDSNTPRRPPATTVEGRENQLIAAAFDLAEQQILEGTASSQVITHFLKAGTTREKLEQQKISYENDLLQARKASLEAQANSQVLFEKAIRAMSTYSGNPIAEDEELDF